jgi:hypothetical protein
MDFALPTVKPFTSFFTHTNTMTNSHHIKDASSHSHIAMTTLNQITALQKQSAMLTAALSLCVAIPASAGTLVALTFDNPLPTGAVASASAHPKAVKVSQSLIADGTIDSYMGEPSKSLVLRADMTNLKAAQTASANLRTGRLSVTNSVSDLASLTLNFDLKVNQLRPVRVLASSYDTAGNFTGSRVTTVNPPIANSYYRFGLDLSTMQADKGVFDPLSRTVEFSFEVSDDIGPDAISRTTPMIVSIDNLTYSAPSYYVSANGDDKADGRSPATAFATPQRAADVATAGDVVMIMNGFYKNATSADSSNVPKEIIDNVRWRPWRMPKAGTTVEIRSKGKPAEWVVFRNYPGHSPVLYNDGTGWQVIKIDVPAQYVEIRGLQIKGNASVNKLADAEADYALDRVDGVRYHGAATFNSNGIIVDNRAGVDNRVGVEGDPRPHHLRFINNAIFDHSGAGATIMASEYITFEGNTAYNNNHFMRYGASGLSYLYPWNWDRGTGHKIFFIGNTAYNNRCDVKAGITFLDVKGNIRPRSTTDAYTDGNGIIIDINRNSVATAFVKYGPYIGRTLVQNNLVFNNGGSGIHTVEADHVDIFYNTAYLNSASSKQEYSQIYTYGSADVRISHNIMVAPVANIAAGEKPEPVNRNSGKNTNVTFDHNLYFGGNIAPEMGEGDRIGDPLFISGSRNPDLANFRLQLGSPARGAGVPSALTVPLSNHAGEPRTQSPTPSLGAY